MNLTPRFFHAASAQLCARNSSKVDLGINFKYPLKNKNNANAPKRSVLVEVDGQQEENPRSIMTNRTPQTTGHDHGLKKYKKPTEKSSVDRTYFELNGAEVLFGVSPVMLALEAGRRTIHRLFVKTKPRTSMSTPVNPRVEAIEALAADRGIPVKRLNGAQLDKLSGGRPHQSVCMDVDSLHYRTETGTDGEVELQSTSDDRLWLFLDKIHDPMNLGAIIRSAYYFGVDKIVTVKGNTCPMTPVVSKASSGAMEIVNMYRTLDSIELIRGKVSEGWTVLGSVSEDSLDDGQSGLSIARLGEYRWATKTIVLVGNEGTGLSVEHQQLCNTVLTIPAGQKLHQRMRSLNVGVATGIILQNYRLQLGNKDDAVADR